MSPAGTGLLYTFVGPQNAYGYAAQVVPVGNYDEDGKPDFVIADQFAHGKEGAHAGQIQVISSADLSVLDTIEGLTSDGTRNWGAIVVPGGVACGANGNAVGALGPAGDVRHYVPPL